MNEQRMRGHISLTNGIDKTFASGQISLIVNRNGSWINLADYNDEHIRGFDAKLPYRSIEVGTCDIVAETIQAARDIFHWVPLAKLRGDS